MSDYNSSLELLKHLVGQFAVTNSEDVQAGIAGNYPVNLGSVFDEVIVFVLYYLEQKKCPHHLAIFLAKRLVTELTSSLRQEECEDPCFPTAAILQMVVLDRLHKLCHHLISQPGLLETEMSNSTPERFASVFAIKNKRRKMEDRHLVIHDMKALYDLNTNSSVSFYGVFDGHGGIDAASFTAAHLHSNMISHPEIFTDTVKAIREAYEITDEQFCKQATDEGLKCGCTAVTVLIIDSTLYLAWLGDSQAMLIKEGKPVTLMQPHTPDRKDERERIEGLGGFVCFLGTWRVNGTLAVSRALGDKDFKPYVSSEPEVETIQLDGTEDFLILACDGLWDGLTPQDAAVTLIEALSDISDNNIYSSAAKKLVYKSKEQGSDDNITAIVVFLNKNASFSLNAFQNSLSEPLATDYREIVYGDSSSENEVSTEENGTLQSDMMQSLNDGLGLPVGSPTYSHSACYSDNAVGLPPEATILSELPTPPIDDIMNEEYMYAQQLDQLSSQENLPNYSSCDMSSMNSSVVDNVPLHEAKDAVQEVASTVVSSVVESAIACVENMKISDSGVEDSNYDMPESSFVAESCTDSSCAQEQIYIASSNVALQNPFTENAVNFADDYSVKQEVENIPSPDTGVKQLVKIQSSVVETYVSVDSEITVDQTSECLMDMKTEKAFSLESTGENLVATEMSDITLVPVVNETRDSFPADQSPEYLVKIETEKPLLPEVYVGKVPEAESSTVETPFNVDVQKSEAEQSPIETLAFTETGNAILDDQILENGLNSDSKADSLLTSSQDLDSSHCAVLLPETVVTDEKSNVAVDLADNVSSQTSPLNLSSACEELPMTSVAIDLASVEVFVPEAEGVEDNDSDSEKDGGWSYVKAADSTAVEQVAEVSSSPAADKVVKSDTKPSMKGKSGASNQVPNTQKSTRTAPISGIKQAAVRAPLSKARVPAKMPIPKQKVATKVSEQTRNVPSRTAAEPSKLNSAAEVAKAKKPAPRESNTKLASSTRKPLDTKASRPVASTTPRQIQKPTLHNSAANTLKPSQNPPSTDKRNTLKPQTPKPPISRTAPKSQSHVANNIKETKNTLTKPVRNVPSLSTPKPSTTAKTTQLSTKTKTVSKPVTPSASNTTNTSTLKSADGSKFARPGLKKTTPIQKTGQSNSIPSIAKKKEATKTPTGRPVKTIAKPDTPRPVPETKSNNIAAKTSEPSSEV